MLKKKLGTEAIERNWSVRHNCLIDYFKIPPTLIIPEGCKRIGESAFYYCQNLEEVEISEGVEVISEWAFHDCVNLRKVIISKTVKKIERHSFEECMRLIEVRIPSNVEEIEWHAFNGCGRIIVPLSNDNNDSLKNQVANLIFWGCSDVKYYAEEETRN